MDTPFSILRQFVLYIISYAFWFTGLTELLYRVTRRWPMVTAIYYHRVYEGKVNIKLGHPVNYTSKTHLEEHIRYFTIKFRLIRVEELNQHLREKALPVNALIISFDDGYRDAYENGLPVLEKYKCPAVFFITTKIFNPDYLLPADQWWFNNLPHENNVRDKRLYLSENDIHHLSMAGYEIGAHSDSHPVLTSISEASQKEEFLISKKKLENILKREVNYFSYPIGGVCRQTWNIVKDAGFTLAFIGHFGTITRNTNPYLLPRNAACDYPLPVLALKIQLSILKSQLFERHNHHN